MTVAKEVPPHMLLRIVLLGALLAAGLTYVKQERVLARIGVVGKCELSQPPAGTPRGSGDEQWWSCGEGAFTGYPSLGLKSCDSVGFVGDRELWSCPAAIESPY